jgi:uracil-DNA glycosylase
MKDKILGSKRIGIFIGQAPPEKNYDIPFAKTRLYDWFEQCGLDKNSLLNLFEFDALVDKFPGKKNKQHLEPSEKDILNHIPWLLKKIQKQKIKLVVPVGKLAIQYVFNNFDIELDKVIGKKYSINLFGKSVAISVIPLPHPSGLSTWSFNKKNRLLLNNALKLIQSFVLSNK